MNRSLIHSEKGNITLISILLFAIAGVTMFLPMLQGSIRSFQNALRNTQIVNAKISAVSGLAYATKALVTEGYNIHQSFFQDKQFVLHNDNLFNSDVTVSYHFLQFHDPNTENGKVIVRATAMAPNGHDSYTIQRAYEYVDLSLFAVYSGGPVQNIVPGTFRVVRQGGRTSYYVEEDNSKIFAPSDTTIKVPFPIFLESEATVYSGDQTLQNWSTEGYRIAQNGNWIIPIRFNGTRYNSVQVLEPEKGLVVNVDPVPGFRNNNRNPIAFNNIIQNIYLRNLYREDNTGLNVYLFTDRLNTGKPMPISMPGGWQIEIAYFPQSNRNPNFPRFRNRLVRDTLFLNFAVLRGTVITKTGIVNTVPFRVHVPNSANGNPSPQDWMLDPGRRAMWALLEEQGLWFCFSNNTVQDMVRKLQDYTFNEGPIILTKLYIK